ncbi:MAG: hypothetical protein AAGA53_17460 [Pseudomonadota bacterium]
MNQTELREQFFAWQCRIRQMAMREDEGRPSHGMCPKVLNQNEDVLADRIVTMIVRGAPEESTEFFKFQVQKNNDPHEIRKKTLTYLQATHYHGPREFRDCLTALFSARSAFARDLAQLEKCSLEFKQFNQGFKLQCNVALLDFDEPEHAATLWHNRCFNPNLGDDVMILKFEPDWLVSSLRAA